MKRLVPAILAVFVASSSFAAIPQHRVLKNKLLKKFSKNYQSKKSIISLQKEIISHKGKAVPALVEVMKDGKYPDKNRWVATFLLGRVMGKKSAPFISKFLVHPSWVMRMASLKTLMALKQTQYKEKYRAALKDNSFIVRNQALETIAKLNLKELGPSVWSMLYDKENYYLSKGKSSKRSNIIRRVIKTVGDLKFDKARGPLFTMIQKSKYKDIFSEIDYALEKITNKKSPKGSLSLKKRFWKKQHLAELRI